MTSLIIWIAYALGTIFFVGCVVAWWEHLGRVRKPAQEIDWELPAPKAVSVDVSLDTLNAPGADIGERRKALGGAMRRMSSGGDASQRWLDTAPMILPGSATHAEPADERERDDVPTV